MQKDFKKQDIGILDFCIRIFQVFTLFKWEINIKVSWKR